MKNAPPRASIRIVAGPPRDKGRKATSVPSSQDSLWQQRAVERGTYSARLLSLARTSQFLAAAMALLEETGDIDFSVQTLVDRAQLSTRAFYQHFEAKEELLLALFEELVTQFVNDLAADIEDFDDPFDRLEAYVRGFVKRAHSSRPFGGRAWTMYQLRLATDHPGDYAKSIARQVELLGSIVRHGTERGAFRTDLPEMAVTLLINSTLVSMAQMDVFGIKAASGPIGADEVWNWCRVAVAPPSAGA